MRYTVRFRDHNGVAWESDPMTDGQARELIDILKAKGIYIIKALVAGTNGEEADL